MEKKMENEMEAGIYGGPILAKGNDKSHDPGLRLSNFESLARRHLYLCKLCNCMYVCMYVCMYTANNLLSF